MITVKPNTSITQPISQAKQLYADYDAIKKLTKFYAKQNRIEIKPLSLYKISHCKINHLPKDKLELALQHRNKMLRVYKSSTLKQLKINTLHINEYIALHLYTLNDYYHIINHSARSQTKNEFTAMVELINNGLKKLYAFDKRLNYKKPVVFRGQPSESAAVIKDVFTELSRYTDSGFSSASTRLNIAHKFLVEQLDGVETDLSTYIAPGMLIQIMGGYGTNIEFLSSRLEEKEYLNCLNHQTNVLFKGFDINFLNGIGVYKALLENVQATIDSGLNPTLLEALSLEKPTQTEKLKIPKETIAACKHIRKDYRHKDNLNSPR